MLIRIRSSAGTERVEIDENATLSAFKSKIKELQPGLISFNLSKNPDGSQSLTNDSASLKSLQLRHGDMLYLKSTGKEEQAEAPPPVVETIKEDEIDRYLESQDGWIQRERDPLYCKHGSNVRCTWCMPLPPWSILEIDPWKKDGLKFIPFHSYIRKIQANSGCKHPEGQKCLNCKSLDQPTYRVKPCTRHPPWPEGICTDCDPGSVIVNSQIYRHVDHVEFDGREAVDTFLQGWRETGKQRCGYLYGKYVPEPSIPLGIRAVAMVIYEPPQESTANSASPKKDPDEEKVEQVANMLGLSRIGFIWTDLKQDPKTGKQAQRSEDLILKGSELIQMAKHQNKNMSPSRQTLSGKCGSKFVSILVTGGSTGDIDFKAYQVSDQCMSLTSAGIITFAKDPSLLRIKKTSKRYIPDVLYRKIDEYKNNIITKAEPTFPPEFFIIPVRFGFPKEFKPLFKSHKFPIEHRDKVQSLAIAKQQMDKNGLVDATSDFHLLLYIFGQIADKSSFEKIVRYFQRRDNEGEVKAILQNLFKDVASSAPSSGTSGTSGTNRPSATAPPTKQTSGTSPTNPKEDEIVTQLVAMGYTATQAKEAVWATGASGIEQAMDFLLR
eukprot:TRINITY_DN7301_c0_g1_i3.p1 TRINITY_DN7301_c0_g1~~TRINITY_DN7301_c0_g1_i3.p1  ORF type:complete len:608 (+),score=145.67 TRINITY_DN7301_c0_g1_i3:158-1981(+)